jgi:hypothetical protein
MTLLQVMLVGAGDGTVPETLYSSWPLAPGGGVHRLHGGRAMATRGARPATLDAALADAGVSRVDFVKMDVDGHECGVLRGAADTLRQGPPVLMELAPYMLDEAGASVEELIEILSAARYALSELESGRPLPLDGRELRALVPVGSSVNVLATRTPPTTGRGTGPDTRAAGHSERGRRPGEPPARPGSTRRPGPEEAASPPGGAAHPRTRATM